MRNIVICILVIILLVILYNSKKKCKENFDTEGITNNFIINEDQMDELQRGISDRIYPLIKTDLDKEYGDLEVIKNGITTLPNTLAQDQNFKRELIGNLASSEGEVFQKNLKDRLIDGGDWTFGNDTTIKGKQLILTDSGGNDTGALVGDKLDDILNNKFDNLTIGDNMKINNRSKQNQGAYYNVFDVSKTGISNINTDHNDKDRFLTNRGVFRNLHVSNDVDLTKGDVLKTVLDLGEIRATKLSFDNENYLTLNSGANEIEFKNNLKAENIKAKDINADTLVKTEKLEIGTGNLYFNDNIDIDDIKIKKQDDTTTTASINNNEVKNGFVFDKDIYYYNKSTNEYHPITPGEAIRGDKGIPGDCVVKDSNNEDQLIIESDSKKLKLHENIENFCFPGEPNVCINKRDMMYSKFLSFKAGLLNDDFRFTKNNFSNNILMWIRHSSNDIDKTLFDSTLIQDAFRSTENANDNNTLSHYGKYEQDLSNNAAPSKFVFNNTGLSLENVGGNNIVIKDEEEVYVLVMLLKNIQIIINDNSELTFSSSSGRGLINVYSQESYNTDGTTSPPDKVNLYSKDKLYGDDNWTDGEPVPDQIYELNNINKIEVSKNDDHYYFEFIILKVPKLTRLTTNDYKFLQEGLDTLYELHEHYK